MKTLACVYGWLPLFCLLLDKLCTHPLDVCPGPYGHATPCQGTGLKAAKRRADTAASVRLGTCVPGKGSAHAPWQAGRATPMARAMTTAPGVPVDDQQHAADVLSQLHQVPMPCLSFSYLHRQVAGFIMGCICRRMQVMAWIEGLSRQGNWLGVRSVSLPSQSFYAENPSYEHKTGLDLVTATCSASHEHSSCVARHLQEGCRCTARLWYKP